MSEPNPPINEYDPATGRLTLCLNWTGQSRRERRALQEAMVRSGLTVHSAKNRGLSGWYVTLTGTSPQFDAFSTAAFMITGSTSDIGVFVWRVMNSR